MKLNHHDQAYSVLLFGYNKINTSTKPVDDFKNILGQSQDWDEKAKERRRWQDFRKSSKFRYLWRILAIFDDFWPKSVFFVEKRWRDFDVLNSGLTF